MSCPGFVLLCGSRSLSVSPALVARLLRRFAPANSWLLISGGARGVDAVAPTVAALLGWESACLVPRYYALGRQAPLRRDDELVALASYVLAVWDGHSTGTAYTVRKAREAGLPVLVVGVDGMPFPPP